MKKIKDKLQQRAKFNKGKRVGYAEGRPVVDRETGEVLENFKPTPKPAPAPALDLHYLFLHLHLSKHLVVHLALHLLNQLLKLLPDIYKQ
jgi:hypothetical protein